MELEEDNLPEVQLRDQAYKAIRLGDVAGLEQLLQEGLTVGDLGPDAARAAVRARQLQLVPFLLGLSKQVVSQDLSQYLIDSRLPSEFALAFLRGRVRLPWALEPRTNVEMNAFVRKYPQLARLLFAELYDFNYWGRLGLAPVVQHYPELISIYLDYIPIHLSRGWSIRVTSRLTDAARALREQPVPLTAAQLHALGLIERFVSIQDDVIREPVEPELKTLQKAIWLSYRDGRYPGLRLMFTRALTTVLPADVARYLQRAL